MDYVSLFEKSLTSNDDTHLERGTQIMQGLSKAYDGLNVAKAQRMLARPVSSRRTYLAYSFHADASLTTDSMVAFVVLRIRHSANGTPVELHVEMLGIDKNERVRSSPRKQRTILDHVIRRCGNSMRALELDRLSAWVPHRSGMAPIPPLRTGPNHYNDTNIEHFLHHYLLNRARSGNSHDHNSPSACIRILYENNRTRSDGSEDGSIDVTFTILSC
ncbi:hypothetical protein Pan216_12500 [Planctomycetes bacterium Pan216]|uniref:Uncharacterized protein n=1 Tax=Kolteria novifilia TaxID=2527975 RepID=A0A518B0C5_9BACT|nr:hypothetical protein Pan216_12500 [Planctomycetes bacterium Pan216]